MRISCPCCGERDASEFAYLGDAAPRRPDPGEPDAAERFHEYVHLRDNPAGAHRELWYHATGCRSWLVVTRDTLTHAIREVARAAEQSGER
jgi:heterotetrameric sarcosine oxidase delta subunit